MESGYYSTRKKNVLFDSADDFDEEEELKATSSLPSIPQPQTPCEPMEFLSRSWSLSASEISKALAQKQKQCNFDPNFHVLTETHQVPKMVSSSILFGPFVS